jgi:hypothetical protein
MEELKAAEDAETQLFRSRTISDDSLKRRADDSPERDVRVQTKKGTQETLSKCKRSLHERRASSYQRTGMCTRPLRRL